MEEKKKSNKKYLLITLGVVGTILLIVGITYAYWILTREQTGENVVNSACLNITFTGENDINLPKAYPMTNEQLDKFLSTNTPYHFTITNECADLANVTINLESLNAEADKQLEDQYINAVLYKDNYKVNFFKNKKLTEDVLNDENKVIEDSLHAYKLYSFTLKQNEEKEFNLQLYLDQDTPMEDANMNATWEGKITLSTGYQEDSKAIRQISYNDSNGMWGYKDKLTKIVIEDKKSVKTAEDGGKVYGPFDESEYGTKAVESYVVCEADDANCVGYLQSDGKVIANPDSSYLFANFPNVSILEGLGKLDTSNVIITRYMFNILKLTMLDLSTFDTTNVKNMSGMFSGMAELQELDLSNWVFNDIISSNFTLNVDISYSKSLTSIKLNNVDTSNVHNMSYMFANLPELTSLDLSYFDTSNVNDMSRMFNGNKTLTNITFGNLFTTNNVQNMSFMFYNCSNLQDLNLSNFNTTKVSSFAYMFSGTTGLKSITFGKNFIHNNDASIVNMFDECPAPERPTGESWDGVSFD